METTAAPSGERERELIRQLHVLTAQYTNPQRLRPRHKAIIKRIKSIEQGYDGSIARCFFCKELGKCDTDIQLHHLNHRIYDNRLENLEPAHQTCNNIENGRLRAIDPSTLACVSEKTSGVQPHQQTSREPDAQEWTSREGEKHDQMRARWDRWIMDIENGPFKNGTDRRLKELTYSAPKALGMGSSVTYRRYVLEDYYGGILTIYENDNGYKMVSLSARPETEKV